jgi:hypothetical protein
MRSTATAVSLMVLVATGSTAARAFTQARCTAAEHARQVREPYGALMLSGLATMTAGVAALASGDHSALATVYLLNAPSLSLLTGILAAPCLVDPQLPEPVPPTLDEQRRRHGDANRTVLWIVAVNTAIAGSAVLFSQNDTSRLISGIATGVSAMSPLLYLDRFLDDSTSGTVAVHLGPATHVVLRF